eukprot:scaffold53954_cov63-Cyclotella_meneghiniana.AAC.3
MADDTRSSVLPSAQPSESDDVQVVDPAAPAENPGPAGQGACHEWPCKAEDCAEVHVKACKGMASQAQIDLFLSLMKNRERKKKAVKRAHDLISDDIISSQGTVSDGIQQRKKSRVDSGGFASANSDLSRNAQDGTIDGCNSADLDAAIAQLVYCKGLPFTFGECPYFQRVLDAARLAPRGFKPPKKNLLAGPMLDIAYNTQLERDLHALLVDAEIFGLAFFGDGATIHKCPLVNIFAAAVYCPAVLINIIDCTERLVAGEKKDGAFISSFVCKANNQSPAITNPKNCD